MKLVFALLISLVHCVYVHGLQKSQNFCDCHETCTGADLVWACGTEERDVWKNPCFDAAFAQLPFCNESLEINDRVKDLLSRIPMSEKLGGAGRSTPLSNYATELPSVGIRYVQWWNEALHGVAQSPGVKFDRVTPSATSFPQIIATSHSYNRSLFHEIGAAIATEVRAFANVGNAGLTYWTPNLNIFRDPRWGRGQETPGEDPYLTGEYVSSYVPGLQVDESDPKHLKISACCKHYVAYSLEDYDSVDRHHFNANVTMQDMADTYLPAFEACASPARGAGSCIMCSYNSVNGVPMCANDEYLGLARNDWKFDGYITSDCGAVEDVYNTHYYASTPNEAVADVLNAGMDTECGKFFESNLMAAHDAGAITDANIDSALANLFRVQMRLGRFDKNTTFNTIGLDAINSDSHQELARDAARQSMVLLKNVDNLALPLNAIELPAGLAVIGPNADVPKTMLGNYEGIPPYVVTPLAGIQETLGASNVHYSIGCDISKVSDDGFAEALDLVSKSSAVVLIMGIDQSQESEGHDRTSIALPGSQRDLINAVLENVGGKKVILVIVGGGAVCLGEYADDNRVSAIIFTGYPGQAGGVGLADVIFGKYSPSGRLTQTFYRGSFVNEVSFFDMNMRYAEPTSGSIGNPGRTYRFYRGESVVYPFGHGLSYSSFQYAWSKHVVPKAQLNHSISLSVLVRNIGKRQAADSVLLFLAPPAGSPASAPIRSLRAFDKVMLGPNEEKVVDFHLNAADFSLADETGKFAIHHGSWTVMIGSLTHSVFV